MEKQKVAFIGSGIIGSGLAVNAMMHGYPTTLQTRSRVEVMKNRVAKILSVMVENNVCTQEEADAAAARATYTTSVEEAVTGAFFIQESGPERLELKRELYAQIEAACPEDALICSSTTALLPTPLQEGSKHPERILVGHPYHPSYLLPLIEICGSEKNSPETIEKAKAIYTDMGKLPIVCLKEARGLVANTMSWSVLHDAKNAVLNGLCSVEDADKALMYGPGMRMALTGQLLTIALGVEGGYRAMTSKYSGNADPDAEKIAAGLDEEMANRPAELGRNEVEIGDFRDKMIVMLLKAQNML